MNGTINKWTLRWNEGARRVEPLYIEGGGGARTWKYLHSIQYITLNLGTAQKTYLQWFSVAWTLIYHDLRHHMVNILRTLTRSGPCDDVRRGSVNKSPHHEKPL